MASRMAVHRSDPRLNDSGARLLSLRRLGARRTDLLADPLAHLGVIACSNSDASQRRDDFLRVIVSIFGGSNSLAKEVRDQSAKWSCDLGYVVRVAEKLRLMDESVDRFIHASPVHSTEPQLNPFSRQFLEYDNKRALISKLNESGIRTVEELLHVPPIVLSSIGLREDEILGICFALEERFYYAFHDSQWEKPELDSFKPLGAHFYRFVDFSETRLPTKWIPDDRQATSKQASYAA